MTSMQRIPHYPPSAWRRRFTITSLVIALGLLAGCVRFSGADGISVDIPTAHQVVADDGHALTVWSRATAPVRPAVLLLHGRTWSALPDFDLTTADENLSVMRALSARGFDVYALDMRGYGNTERDASGWLTPNRAAEDLATVLRWIDQRHRGSASPDAQSDVTVLGWSYGSMVAMLTAQKYPRLFGRLVLYGFPRDVDAQVPLDHPSGPPERRVNTVQAAAEDFIVEGSDTLFVYAGMRRGGRTADPVRMDWRERHQWNQLQGARVTRPTLLLQAEHDPYMNVAADARLFQALGTAQKQWVILPDADHAALLENSRFQFIHAIVSFIEWTRL